MRHLLSIIFILAVAACAPPQDIKIGDSVYLKLGTNSLDNASESDLMQKDIIAVYYSAHWCPPCRAFTPELVEFYDRAIREYSNFQLILVSSDENNLAMHDYMKWGNMKWLAVNQDRLGETELEKHAARGIPYMVVLDQDGKQILGAPKGKDWVHPSVVLEQLEDLLKEKGKKA